MSERQGKDNEESEPLFSASSRDDVDGDAIYDRAAGGEHESDETGGSALGTKGEVEDNIRFPPPKYQQTAREYEYEADDGTLQDGEGVELPTLHERGGYGDDDGPRLQGLLGRAATRGSIDSSRRQESTQSYVDDSIEEGLVVGAGSGGGILASVS